MTDSIINIFVLLGLCGCIIHITCGLNNGLAQTPPMGWRSWNAYHGSINQNLIEKVLSAITDRSRSVYGIGNNISLLDMGYSHIGIDDTWQLCNQTSGHYFHNNTAPYGWPNVNLTRFPNLTQLITNVHSNNCKIDWYMNNCVCAEYESYPANEVNDVKFLINHHFDGVKLDSCGSSHNITNWQHLINITSMEYNNNKPLLTENCYNRYPNFPTNENSSSCPMNFYRICTDINANYVNIIGINLASTITYNNQYPNGYLTYPTCWAYPDMLEIGNINNQYKAIASDMDQSHFSAWCVVSSPLILSFDLTNNDKINSIWDIMTNHETIAVSQNWAGHPGRRIANANYTIKYTNLERYMDRHGVLSDETVTLMGYEIWAKPQPNNTWAVLILNNDGENSHNITLNFKDIPWNDNIAFIRDIVKHKDLGTFENTYTAWNIRPFASLFLLLSKPSVN